MELKELKRGKNRWCGPAVTSFITGLTTDEAGALYRSQNPGRNATGMSNHAVRKMLRTCGYWTTPVAQYSKDSRPTLAQWLKSSVGERTSGRVFLIIAGSHWQIVTGRRYACGIVGGIVSIKHPKVKRRARVAEVYEVDPLANAVESTAKVQRSLGELTALKRQKYNRQAGTRRQARSLAARLGVDMDVDDFGGGSVTIYLDVPGWLSDLREEGEVDFTTVAYDWDDAVDCLNMIDEIMQMYE